jgi:hypothetical protein
MLGKVNIVTQFIEGCRTSINKHNEEVRKNRGILSKIIVSSSVDSLNFHCVAMTKVWTLLTLDFLRATRIC